LKKALRKLLYRAARSYVAGPELSDAIEFAHSVEKEGLSSTIAYWNDVGEDPGHVLANYLSAIEQGGDAHIQTYVSIKAPALGMSPKSVESLAMRCAERSIGLHFDSLGLEHQAGIFELIAGIMASGATLGCTLPGRFRRSLDDVELAVEHRLRVRVVKGQWSDPHHAIEPRAGFISVIERLAGRAAHVSVATHDPALAVEALAQLRAQGTPADLELLLGLPVRRIREVAQRLEVPVRMYIPYGYAWLPYSVAAARKNPRILLWMLEDALRGGIPRTGRRS
jgi:proline dehydrogenase